MLRLLIALVLLGGLVPAGGMALVEEAMPNLAILELTDGTTTIDLLKAVDSGSDKTGYIVSSWRPAVAYYKGDGTWVDSPLAYGRRLVDKQFATVIESIELKGHGTSADDLIREGQEIRRLLEKASDYWASDWQDEPVYLKARAFNETNTRYAILLAGRIPDDENPYGQPFLQPGCEAAADNLTLVIERQHWQEVAPGSDTCVKASGSRGWDGISYVSDSFTPSQSEDDGWLYQGGGQAFALASTQLAFGNYTAGPTAAGLRFRSVTIPQGATIIEAYITFEAALNGVNDYCRVVIYGEDVDDAPVYTAEAEAFYNRAQSLTAASVEWPVYIDDTSGIEQWTQGTDYNTPSLVEIVQEIVDRTGWASGNDLAFQFWDNYSDTGAARNGTSWDHVTRTEPTLYVTYIASGGSYTFGRTETCLEEVYVINKEAVGQLTHVYHEDNSAGTFPDGNLVVETAYDIFVDPINDDDAAYWGIDEDAPHATTFNNLVFDIKTAAVYVGGATIEWQYSQGAAAWATLDVQDNTDDGTGPFSLTGVKSVHWDPPTDWAVDTVNGVTAYWVRALPTVGGDSISTPEQQNRYVYTTIWSSVLVDEAQVPGDIPAAARFRIKNVSDDGRNPQTVATRVSRAIVALRSTARGTSFVPYLNILEGDENQNPIGINVELLGANWAQDATVRRAPGGLANYWNPGGVGVMGNRVRVDFLPTIAAEYYGSFRVFVLASQLGGTAGDFEMELEMRSGSYRIPSLWWTSDPVVIPLRTAAYQWALNDFGLLTFPRNLSSDDTAQGMSMYIRASNASVGADGDLYIFALILMPVDEAIWDIWGPNPDTAGDFIGAITDYQTVHRYALIDSTTHPKVPLRVLTAREDNDNIENPSWRPLQSGRAILQANADQRIFVLTGIYDVNDDWDWEPHYSHTVQIWRAARYLSMRGDR